MKGDCYHELVEVFYNNVKEVDGNVHSRVKGVDIIINSDIWWRIAELKDAGNLSHQFDCPQNMQIRKTEMFKNFMRYRGRLTPTDVCLLYAIVQKIPTNWVAVFKRHILEVGTNDWHRLPYGVLINKVLEQCGVNLAGKNKLICGKENVVGKSLTTLNEKMDEIFKHFVEFSSSSEEYEREDVDAIIEESTTGTSESE
ncbi:hypothetical protein V8G54_029017 [Vigna mungo]|uniref:Uncharacterized protein n=1 Tax=Vigna mungo TaxID=3915 RepID=A0AAQ3RJX8_VIGMU